MGSTRVADALTSVKLVAFGAMVADHANRIVWDGSSTTLGLVGRMAFPLFALVLAYNLARPSVIGGAPHRRTTWRLLLMGVAVTPLYVVTLGSLPLNIFFTLAAAAHVIWLLHSARVWLALALAAVVGFGVDYGWAGMACIVVAWWYFRMPNLARLYCLALAFAGMSWLTVGSTAALICTMATLPLAWALVRLRVHTWVPRWTFYAAYPAHLAILALWKMHA